MLSIHPRYMTWADILFRSVLVCAFIVLGVILFKEAHARYDSSKYNRELGKPSPVVYLKNGEVFSWNFTPPAHSATGLWLFLNTELSQKEGFLELSFIDPVSGENVCTSSARLDAIGRHGELFFFMPQYVHLPGDNYEIRLTLQEATHESNLGVHYVDLYLFESSSITQGADQRKDVELAVLWFSRSPFFPQKLIVWSLLLMILGCFANFPGLGKQWHAGSWPGDLWRFFPCIIAN
jgi:hypothetical protein